MEIEEESPLYEVGMQEDWESSLFSCCEGLLLLLLLMLLFGGGGGGVGCRGEGRRRVSVCFVSYSFFFFFFLGGFSLCCWGFLCCCCQTGQIVVRNDVLYARMQGRKVKKIIFGPTQKLKNQKSKNYKSTNQTNNQKKNLIKKTNQKKKKKK